MAAESFAQSLLIEPDSATAHLGAAWSLASAGEHRGAGRHMDRACKLDPDRAELRAIRLLVGEMGRGREPAEVALACAPGLDPFCHVDGDGRMPAQLVEAALDRCFAAEISAQAMMMINVEFNCESGELGCGTHEEMSRSDARIEYDRCVEVLPGEARAHAGMGRIRMRDGRHEEAAVCLKKALEIDGGMAEARVGLGWALANAGRPGEALRALDEAAVRAAQAPLVAAEAHLCKGWVLRAIGRPDEALRALDEAARLDPARTSVHGGRCLALVEMGRSADAESLLPAAALREPDVPGACRHAGLVPAPVATAGLPARPAGRDGMRRSLDPDLPACRSSSPPPFRPDRAVTYSSSGLLVGSGRLRIRLPTSVHPGGYSNADECGILAGAPPGVAALVLDSLGLHTDAFKKYHEAVEADPKSAMPRLLWARVLDEVGLYGMAVGRYNEAIGLGSGREAASAYRGRGWALARWGRHAKDEQAEDEDYEDEDYEDEDYEDDEDED